MHKYLGKFTERRKDITSILTTIIIGILLIGYISNVNANHKILLNQANALGRHSDTLNQITTTENNIKNNEDSKLADLQSHVDCLYNLATQSDTTAIAAASACHLTPSSQSVTSTPKTSSTGADTNSAQGSASPTTNKNDSQTPANNTSVSPGQSATQTPPTGPVSTCKFKLVGLCLIH